MRHVMLSSLAALVLMASYAAPVDAQSKGSPRLNGSWSLDLARSDPMPGATRAATAAPDMAGGVVMGTPPSSTTTLVTTAPGGAVTKTTTVVTSRGSAVDPADLAAPVTPSAPGTSLAVRLQLRNASSPKVLIIAATADTALITEGASGPTVWLTDKKKHKLPQNDDGITQLESSWSSEVLNTTRTFSNKMAQQREFRLSSDGETLEVRVSWSGNGINESFTLRYRRQ